MKKLICLLLVLAFLTLVACDAGDTVTTDMGTTTTIKAPTTITEAPATTTESLTTTTEAPATITEALTTTESAVAPYARLEVAHILPVSNESEDKIENIEYKKGDASFILNNAETTANTLTLLKASVSAVSFGKKFADNTTAKYECTVDSASTDPSSFTTLYFGFRLQTPQSDATSQSGVWIALRNDEIGLRTNAWPETTYMKLPEGISFKKPRRIVFEDNMSDDTITVKADNDAGEAVAVAIIKLENGYINMYAPDDESVRIKDKITNEILANGYFSIWLHFATVPSTVTGLKLSGSLKIAGGHDDVNTLASRDIFADTWVCVDDEGRDAASGKIAPNGRKVGIFYFLWHDGSSSQPIYDHSASYYSGGVDALKKTMTSGPLGFAHYWAEPYFGYYRSDDEWVIRKHAYQLSAAGVDFIYIDVTNGLIYERSCEAVFRVFSQMRAEGYDTPQIMFHCGDNINIAPSSFNALWDNYYSQGRYKDLWFEWNGKPLIFMPKALYRSLSKEKKDFFTVRQSWAYTKPKDGSWYTKVNGRNCWPWADMYPQSVGKSRWGKVEQMIVMCGFWVNGSYGTNAGRSYHNGKQPDNKTNNDFGFSLVEESSGKGYAYQEQFDLAIETAPPVIMITGWNEWWAGRWEGSSTAGQTIANTYTVNSDDAFAKNYYVDCFNPEFSRDVEPVKGLFNDNYYYQTVQNVREYKGSRTTPCAFGQKNIDINGSVAEWFSVGPEYRDAEGDTVHRDFGSYVGQLRYTNDSGRNDFVTAKVSSDSEYLYFYAQCADKITDPKGSEWMNLFINADASQPTGWYGYDFVLNRSRSGNTCSVDKMDGWSFTKVGNAEYTLHGSVLQIKVSKSLLGIGDTFDFKWADNSVDDGDIMKFIDRGDAAPNDRFNYRYTTKTVSSTAPDCLTSDMTVLKAGSYNAYHGGKTVMLDSQNTNAVMLGEGKKLYVPLAFAKSALGLNPEYEGLNHYGVKYCEISQLLEADGKAVTYGEGIVVISDKKLKDISVTEILYNSLY